MIHFWHPSAQERKLMRSEWSKTTLYIVGAGLAILAVFGIYRAARFCRCWSSLR
jgi:hypothetical protein